MTQLDGRTLEVLTLELQGEVFALEATQVYEILDQTQITEVPGSDPFLSGLVVIDVTIDGEPVTVGILADKVNEVTELTAAVLQETPKLGMKWRPEFIRCIGKHGSEFIAILDIDRIFAEHQEAAVGMHASGPDQSAA
jgi:purine-binding chemotaxis protein CheW